ncbi:MAG: glycosyltransferase family 4 protein [Bacteroidales bacterium]
MIIKMETTPHILILPMYYPEKDSSPHRGYMFYEQARSLTSSGCKVGIAFTEQRPLKNITLKSFFRESHFQISAEKTDQIIICRMHAWNPKLSTHPGGLIWSLLTLLLVRRYIRRFGKPDLIHAHFGLWAGFAASVIKKIYGIDYVVTEHASSINAGKISNKQATILRKAYRNAASVICVGSKLAENIRRYTTTDTPVSVIPNFVDTGIFQTSGRNTHKEKNFRFVSIGNLVPRKGFSDLIAGFAEAFSQMPHVCLWIIGDGEEAPLLQEQIAALKMEGRISLLGVLPREEVAQRLAECDAFVLPSYAETFGIVFIEAMATGMPAIGTVCGGPEDIITPENGYLLTPGDQEALVKHLKNIYLNYHLFDRKKISLHIRENYDFRLAGHKLKEIYLKECIRKIR